MFLVVFIAKYSNIIHSDIIRLISEEVPIYVLITISKPSTPATPITPPNQSSIA